MTNIAHFSNWDFEKILRCHSKKLNYFTLPCYKWVYVFSFAKCTRQVLKIECNQFWNRFKWAFSIKKNEDLGNYPNTSLSLIQQKENKTSNNFCFPSGIVMIISFLHWWRDKSLFTSMIDFGTLIFSICMALFP